MGKVITFYSYKGGVGRSMALANVAVLLAQWEYKVLMIDWDLEAPGLECFFAGLMDAERSQQHDGIADLLTSTAPTREATLDTSTWKDFVQRIPLPNGPASIDFISAGKRDDLYFKRVRSFDMPRFYGRQGGMLLERLRTQWTSAYDFVLVDSRTGITDFSGVCTIHLPDILVLCFTATAQSLSGAIDVSCRASRLRKQLPVDRTTLLTLPIASRFDTSEEYQVSQEWLDRFAAALRTQYASWLPATVKARDFLSATKIPYIPYFSFGEGLATIASGTPDPTSLAYAYETLAALLGNELQNADQVLSNRDQYVRAARKSRRQQAFDTPPEDQGAVRPQRAGQVFISYSREDRETVAPLYSRLLASGVRPWMDTVDLLPGQDWRVSIESAIKASDVLLLCYSGRSAKSEGFIKKEMDLILSIRPAGSVLIPVGLDDTTPPKPVSRLQTIVLSEPDAPEKLLEACIRIIRSRQARRALVVTTIGKEYEAVRDRLQSVHEETLSDGTICDVGDLASTGKWQVYVVETGAMGTQGPAQVARLVQVIQPKVVMRVGVGGAVEPMAPDTVVVASDVYDLSPVKGSATEPVRVSSGHSYRLAQRARAEARKGDWLQDLGFETDAEPSVVVAPVGSGNLINWQGGAKELSKTTPRIRAVDMEAAGISGALYASRDIESLVVLGLIDTRKSSDPAGITRAAGIAAAFALHALSKLEVSTDDVPDDTHGVTASRQSRFLNVCRRYLKKDFATHEASLARWYGDNLRRVNEAEFDGFITELERTVTGTPSGKQRRSGVGGDSAGNKLLSFLENLRRKHMRE